MFAVPGWSSLSAQSLQTQTLRNTKFEPDSNPKQKKRKRNNGASEAAEVDPNKLAEFWGTVVEGKSKSESGTVKRAKKRQKMAGAESESTQADAEKPALTPEEQEKFDQRKQQRKITKREKLARLKASKKAARTTTETVKEDSKVKEGSKATAVVSAPSKQAHQLTPLQDAMRHKLISARFRHLNQTLYTTPSAHSHALFQENPEMFQEYHEGFRRQVEVWPENPVDGYIAQIRARGKVRGSAKGRHKDQRKSKPSDAEGDSSVLPLPRTSGICYIADLGCGDAALSSNLQKDKKKLKLEISSYDLQSPSPLVTKADIAKLPLEDDSIDVAIFCLALMGTNWIDFIEEAYRVLHWKGELWISEIKSRFGRVESSKKRVDHSVGNRKKPDKKTLKKMEDEDDDADLTVQVDDNPDKKSETDVSAFVEVLRQRGFVLKDGKSIDLSNRMFVRMQFVKAATPIKGKGAPMPKVKKKFIEQEEDTDVSAEEGVLKPCVYKVR